MSVISDESDGIRRAESVILNKLIEDPQMQEMVVMEVKHT